MVRITCSPSCGHVYETKQAKKDMLRAYSILMTRKPQQKENSVLQIILNLSETMVTFMF